MIVCPFLSSGRTVRRNIQRKIEKNPSQAKVVSFLQLCNYTRIVDGEQKQIKAKIGPLYEVLEKELEYSPAYTMIVPYTPYSTLYIHQSKFNSTPLSILTSVNLVHDSPTTVSRFLSAHPFLPPPRLRYPSISTWIGAFNSILFENK